MDIHHYDKVIKHAYATLDREKFSDRDKELIRKFAEHLKARGISDGRIAKYMLNLMVLRRHMVCDFEEAGREEMVALMSWLNSENYSPHTKMDFKGELKRFYKWLRNGSVDSDAPYPPEVAWIKDKMKRNEMRQPDILTEEEVMRMI